MTAYDDLLQDPRGFLISRPLSLFGANNYGTAQFFDHTAQNDIHGTSTAFRPYGEPGTAFTAWNLPMINEGEQADRTNLRNLHVPDTNTPVIITGGLTGCCVAIARISPTELRLSHVRSGGTWEDGSDRGDGDAVETSPVSYTHLTLPTKA